MSCNNIHLAAKASAGSEGWRAAAIAAPLFHKHRETQQQLLVSLVLLETRVTQSVHAEIHPCDAEGTWAWGGPISPWAALH